MADYPPKKNAAFTFYVSLISQADTKIAQANPTLAAGDVKVAIDDGAPANLGTLPVADADFTKRVKVVLTAGEMNGDNISIIFSDAAGAEWCDLMVNIQTATRQLTDLAYPATSGRSMVVDAAGLVDANTVKVGPTGSGTAQTAGDIPARLPAALVSGRMDASLGAVAAGVDLSATMKASVNAEVVDALNVDTYAEPSGAPPATASLVRKIGQIYMTLRNKFTSTASAKTFFDDGGASEWTKALSDNGTTYTEDEGV